MPYASSIDTEAGFQYSATYNYYTFYAKTTDVNNNAVFYEDSQHELANDDYSLGIQAYNVGNPVLPTPMPTGTPVNLPCATDGCVIVSFSASCPGSGGSVACAYTTNMADKNYSANSGNSMIAAVMTTIAQTKDKNNYSDGYRFGPNAITSSQTEHYTGMGLQVDSQWATGGTQNWPNDATRVESVPQHGTGMNSINETDTLNFYHLLNGTLQ